MSGLEAHQQQNWEGTSSNRGSTYSRGHAGPTKGPHSGAIEQGPHSGAIEQEPHSGAIEQEPL